MNTDKHRWPGWLSDPGSHAALRIRDLCSSVFIGGRLLPAPARAALAAFLLGSLIVAGCAETCGPACERLEADYDRIDAAGTAGERAAGRLLDAADQGEALPSDPNGGRDAWERLRR